MTDFRGFTNDGLVKRVITSARRLPGESFPDITSEIITNIVEVPNQPVGL